MSKPVAAVRAKQSVHEAAHVMAEHDVSGLAVLDDDGKAVGVISASDIVRYEITRRAVVLSEEEHRRLKDQTPERIGSGFHIEHLDQEIVQDLMTPRLVTTPAAATVAYVARLMAQHKVHRVFVEEGGRIVGIVTALDVARTLGEAIRPVGSSWESWG